MDRMYEDKNEIPQWLTSYIETVSGVSIDDLDLWDINEFLKEMPEK